MSELSLCKGSDGVYKMRPGLGAIRFSEVLGDAIREANERMDTVCFTFNDLSINIAPDTNQAHAERDCLRASLGLIPLPVGPDFPEKLSDFEMVEWLAAITKAQH